MRRETSRDDLVVVDHPLVADRLSRLRDVTTPDHIFRQLVAEISSLVAYEALRDLQTAEIVIDTPIASSVRVERICETVLLVPVLRAGLGMVPAVQELLPLTQVAHVGLRRDEETLRSEVYLNRLPRELDGRRVIVCDPMLATGGSLVQVCDMVRERGAKEVIVLCIIASEPGIAVFRAAHPLVRMYCAAVDRELNEVGYIVPGLGDAGDRLFGPPD